MLALVLLAFTIRLQAVVFVPAIMLAVGVQALCARDLRVIRRLVPSLAVLGLAAAIGLVVRSAGSGSPLGAYETADESDYDLGAALTWIGWHAADISLLVVTVPLFAALVLLVQAILRQEDDPDVQALVAVAVSYGVVSVVVVGVFASVTSDQLAERDLVSVTPPLFVAFAVWLGRGLPRPQPIALVIVAPPVQRRWCSYRYETWSPRPRPLTRSCSCRRMIEEATSPGTLEVAWSIAVCALVALAALVPRRGAPVLAALVMASLVGASVVAQRELDRRTHTDRAQVFATSPTDWIDRAASAPVTYLYADDPLWTGVWQIAFWNPNVSSVVAISGDRFYGPVPGQTDVDILEDGTLVADGHRLAGGRAVVSPANMVVDGKRPRLQRTGARRAGLVLWQARDPLRLRLRTTQLSKERVTGMHFTVEVFECDGGSLKASFSARDSTTMEISVDGGGQSTLEVPGGKTAHATVRLPRQANSHLCLVAIRPEGRSRSQKPPK